MSLADVVLVFLWGGISAYVLFGGADFGADRVGADRDTLGATNVVYPARTDWSGSGRPVQR